MQIHKSIDILDLALLIGKKILVISDLHLGFEEALNKLGVLVPRFHYKDIKEKLDSIFRKINSPDKIILNGDLKHEFGRISNQEWKELLDLFDFLKTKCHELIIIKGNHDPIIEPIARKREIKVVKEFRENNILVIHGDKIPEKLEGVIIIGHEHPAISLKDEAKIERFKCFLKGKFKRKILIVQPSFNPSIEGSDVLKEKLLSPFLTNLSDFEVFVVEKEEVLKFGKVKDFQ